MKFSFTTSLVAILLLLGFLSCLHADQVSANPSPTPVTVVLATPEQVEAQGAAWINTALTLATLAIGGVITLAIKFGPQISALIAVAKSHETAITAAGGPPTVIPQAIADHPAVTGFAASTNVVAVMPPNQPTIAKVASLIAILAFATGILGCSTIQSLTSSSNVSNLEQDLATIVEQSAVNALNDYATTGKVNEVGDVAYTVATAIRTLEGTNQITNTAAVQSAIESGGTPSQIAQQLAPIVAQTAAQLISQGANSTQAGEVSASALDSAATKVAP